MRAMNSNGFRRYDLRTTDPEAARAFYSEVLGLDIPRGEEAPDAPSILCVWLLHEQARARGVPPHWLGHVGVADVEAAAHRLVELGSQRLGPTVSARDGTTYATLRDPAGAVLAVRAFKDMPAGAPVAWHHLHTNDLDRVWAVYSELFGWRQTGALDVADPVGGYRMFSWDDSSRSLGSMANTARWPGVHAHWLFYFPVADLEAALTTVHARGGRAAGQRAVLPDGTRLAPCEDAQGAAFGLLQA
jgi:predicted enzyme related to lactoylglutathione lyase